MSEWMVLAFQMTDEQAFNRMLYTVLGIGAAIMAFGVTLILLFMKTLEEKPGKAVPPKSQLYLGLLIGVVFVLCIVFLYLAYQKI